MSDYKQNTKMKSDIPCFKEGGSVYKSRHSEKSEMKEDVAQDKKIIKKALAMHDKQEHPGEKTDLSKLKKGGRPVRRYKAGGAIGMKKDDGDIDDIKKIKSIKAKKLCMGGKS